MPSTITDTHAFPANVDIGGALSFGGVAAAFVTGVAGGYKIARGNGVSVAAVDTVVTGLATVVAATVSLDVAPAAAHAFVTVSIGDQAGSPAAGSIIISTWTSTYSAELTAWGTARSWIAVGT